MLFLVTAHAQNYPARAARIVIPPGPGGGNDSIARMVAQKLSIALKQQFVADNRPVAAMPQAKAGRLRAIAMTGTKRWPVAPELPTVAEAGLPDYAAEGWYGIAAPAGTPRAIVDLLSRELAAAAKGPDVADRLSVEGVIAVGSTPEEFAAYITKDYDRVGKVVKVSSIKFD